jgi:ribosome maturation factor RimP
MRAQGGPNCPPFSLAFFWTGTVDIIERINQIIEPSLTALGYHLVQVKLADGARRKTLSIMAERKDGTMMSFNDCTQISHTASALLDVDDPITGAYDLEVCSPGLDRPLTQADDFSRYAGYEIKCETLIPTLGRKRFRGILKGIAGQTVTLVMEGADVEIPYANIRSAKLVVNDAVVSEALRKQKKAEEDAEKEAKAQKKTKKQST